MLVRAVVRYIYIYIYMFVRILLTCSVEVVKIRMITIVRSRDNSEKFFIERSLIELIYIREEQ